MGAALGQEPDREKRTQDINQPARAWVASALWEVADWPALLLSHIISCMEFAPALNGKRIFEKHKFALSNCLCSVSPAPLLFLELTTVRLSSLLLFQNCFCPSHHDLYLAESSAHPSSSVYLTMRNIWSNWSFLLTLLFFEIWTQKETSEGHAHRRRPCKYTRRWSSTSQGERPEKKPYLHHLDLGLPALGELGENTFLFEAFSLWCFVKAALTN